MNKSLSQDRFFSFWPFSGIFRHVANGRQGSPSVAKGLQGSRRTPGLVEMSLNQIDHIQVIFQHDIQNRAISPLKFPLKTKSALPIGVIGQ